jgi:hypothetical protein
MSLQKIIDTAVNLEINRTKLVAQSVSRSGKILTAARNWTNPYRFTVTPKPIWEYNKMRDLIEDLYTRDRNQTHTIIFGDYGLIRPNYNTEFTGSIAGTIMTVTALAAGALAVGDAVYSNSGRTNLLGFIVAKISGFGATSVWKLDRTQTVSSTTLYARVQTEGNLRLEWMTRYLGDDDDNGNRVIDNYVFSSGNSTAIFVTEGATAGLPAANDFIVRKNDWIRPSGDSYPYQAAADIPVPTAITGYTGSISGTATETTVTGLSSIANLSVGQVLTESGSNTGSFGGLTYIKSVDSATQITIVSSSANTAGAITFDGAGISTAGHAVAIPIHRGYLGGSSAGTLMLGGGGACRFFVKIVRLPTYRFVNKDLIEFTGDFELIEEIL